MKSNYVIRKFSTLLVTFVLLAAGSLVISPYINIEEAYAVTGVRDEENIEKQVTVSTVGKFGFSYTKGNYVDGSTNSKFYSLKSGKTVRFNVTDVMGAASSSPIEMRLRYKNGRNTITVCTTRFYRKGVQNGAKLVNTSNNYYIFAKGGAGSVIGANGEIQCY